MQPSCSRRSCRQPGLAVRVISPHLGDAHPVFFTMSLDKSLDDIISSTRKAKRATRVGKVGKTTKTGKKVGSANKKPIVSFKKPAVAEKPQLDLSYATKVVVSGLPKDIRADAIKVCA